MIKTATPADLRELFHLCDEFSCASASVSYKKEIFLENWTKILESGLGIILLLPDNKGFLGGLKYPDINTGVLSAVETFWFVTDSARGQGLRLLRNFEKWAKDNDCRQIIMVHLADLMPDAVRKIYLRMGYNKLETHYIKRLSNGN